MMHKDCSGKKKGVYICAYIYILEKRICRGLPPPGGGGDGGSLRP